MRPIYFFFSFQFPIATERRKLYVVLLALLVLWMILRTQPIGETLLATEVTPLEASPDPTEASSSVPGVPDLPSSPLLRTFLEFYKYSTGWLLFPDAQAWAWPMDLSWELQHSEGRVVCFSNTSLEGSVEDVLPAASIVERPHSSSESRNYYRIRNLCVPVASQLHGVGLLQTSLSFQTEINTAFRDLSVGPTPSSHERLSADDASSRVCHYAPRNAPFLVVHPVGPHSSNLFHVVNRLASLIVTLSQLAQEVAAVRRYVAQLHSGALTNTSFFSKKPFALPRPDVLFAFVLVNNDNPPVSSSLYRSLAQALAGKSHWFSTFGMKDDDTTLRGSLQAQFPAARVASRRAEKLFHRASSLCFEDSLVGWAKVPMHSAQNSRRNETRDAFLALRSAVLQYYYPSSHYPAADPFCKKALQGAFSRSDIRMLRPLRVTVIRRGKSRKIVNLDAAMTNLRTHFARSQQQLHFAGGAREVSVDVTFREVDLARLRMVEQIRIAAETDILFSVHGAGLTHLLFMKHCAPHCVAVEIIPPVRFPGSTGVNVNEQFAYGGLCKLVGVHHLAVRLPIADARTESDPDSIGGDAATEERGTSYDINLRPSVAFGAFHAALTLAVHSAVGLEEEGLREATAIMKRVW